MNNTKITLLLVAAIVGLSFVIISSINIVEISTAQQQEGIQTQNNTNMTQPKFLKNSTSFGNATAELTIKHAPQLSALFNHGQ